jgi:WD40 repeat protein
LSNAQEGGVRDLAYAPDGRTLATVGDDGLLRLWEVATGRLLWPTEKHKGVELHGVAFSPDGKRVAVAGDDYAAVIYDAARGEELLALKDHKSVVYAVAFNHDGTKVATAAWDGLCRIFDAHKGTLLAALPGGSAPLYDVAFSPDGTQVAAVSGDGFVRVWDTADGKLRYTLDSREGNPQAAGQARGQDLVAVAFSPDGKTVAAAGRARTILTWSLAGGRLTGVQRDAHVDVVRNLAYSPDGTWLASAGWDVTAKIWPPALGTATRTITGHTDQVMAVAFRNDGKQLATGSMDGSVLFTLLDKDELTKLAHSRLVRPLTAEECPQYAELGLCP